MRGGIGIGVPMPSAQGSFVPTMLDGIALWLRSDMGISLNGSDVSAWADLSGNERHATQGTASLQPPYTLGAAPGGHPAIGPFDGVDDRLVTSAFSANQPIDIFTVALVAATTGTGRSMLDGTSVNTRLVYDNGANINIFAGANVNSGVGPTAWRRIRGKFNGASSGITVGDAAEVSGNAGAAAATGLTIGSRGGGSNPTDGSIAEVIMYSRELDDDEAARVMVYLKGRYGI